MFSSVIFEFTPVERQKTGLFYYSFQYVAILTMHRFPVFRKVTGHFIYSPKPLFTCIWRSLQVLMLDPVHKILNTHAQIYTHTYESLPEIE